MVAHQPGHRSEGLETREQQVPEFGVFERIFRVEPEGVEAFPEGESAAVVQGSGQHEFAQPCRGKPEFRADVVRDIGHPLVVVHESGTDQVHGFGQALDQGEQLDPGLFDHPCPSSRPFRGGGVVQPPAGRARGDTAPFGPDTESLKPAAPVLPGSLTRGRRFPYNPRTIQKDARRCPRGLKREVG